MKGLIKTTLLFFPLTVLIALTACSNKTYPIGTFQQTPVTVDGDLREWNEPLRFASTGGQVQYNVTNDNDNIYVSIETHDESSMLKILRAGINIYFDPAAGQSKKTFLSFPLASPMVPGEGKPMNGGGKHDQLEALFIQAISFSATGFQNMENRLYDITDRSKIKVAMKQLVNNGLGYEAVIPLQYIFGTAAISKDPSRNLSVGIIINALNKEGGNSRAGNAYSGSGGGMRGGGRGGGGGGGRGMGGGGGGYHRGNTNSENTEPGTQTPDRSALYKQETNWYKFKLAVKK